MKISPYKVLRIIDKLAYSVFVGAIIEAVYNGVDVVNISLKSSGFDDENQNFWFEQTLKDAIIQNVVFVAAAGNSSGEADLLIPGKYPEVITVSACDQFFHKASFSNYGTCVDVSAPGVNIVSTVTNDKIKEYPELFNVVDDGLVIKSGTSMAAPLVSALAALLKSINPNATPAAIERIIKQSAYIPTDWAESCEGKEYGVGVIDFYNAVQFALKEKTEIRINAEKNVAIMGVGWSDAIYYTIDGTDPTPENGMLYTKPLNLKNKRINLVKAASFLNGSQIGDISSFKMVSYINVKINIGETQKIVSDSYKGIIHWKSDNTSVVAVDDKGFITGVSKGQSRVVATMESGKRMVFVVTVKEQPYQWLIDLFFVWLSSIGIKI